jgi:Na+-transporting methylmalonyl-CoA/oxaloacetate decarboxylase gamma subunit
MKTTTTKERFIFALLVIGLSFVLWVLLILFFLMEG